QKYGLERFVKLSSNENPLGTSPLALAAIRAMGDLQIYVDDDHHELRRWLAEPYGLGVEHTIVGHGSNELVRALFTAFLTAGDEVVMADPTFSLFPKDAVLFDAVPVKVPLRDGVHDLDAMLAAVTPKTKLVIVVDPNNPTSTRFYLDMAELLDHAMLAAVTPKTKLVIVVDPNTPTSTRVEREAFDRFVRALPERVILMIDQA